MCIWGNYGLVSAIWRPGWGWCIVGARFMYVFLEELGYRGWWYNVISMEIETS